MEATASALLWIYMDHLIEEEELEEWMRDMVNDVVDAGHGDDEGEDFDYDQNDYDQRPDHYSVDC